MSMVKFFKVSTLPGTLEANSLYFVLNSGYAESYVTDDAGVAKAIGNSTMIEEVANNLLGGSSFRVVSNITERNALTTGDTPFLVLVADATTDTTVNAGGALYAWKPDAGPSGEFRKVAEYESMDIDFGSISIAWSQLTGAPTSSVVDIDDAVTKRHVHTNKSIIDELNENGSEYLTYKGNVVGSVWSTLNW